MKKKLLDRLKTIFYRLFKTEAIRRIVENSSYLLSATGVTMMIGLVQGALVFRLIGAQWFGLIKAINRFTSTANRITSFRINEMVVTYVRLFKEQGEDAKAAAVYKLAVILESLGAVAAFLLIWALAPWGAGFFGQAPETYPLWVFYGSMVLLNFTLESSGGMLQVFQKFRIQAVLNILDSASTFIVVALAYINHWGVVEVLLAYYLGKVIRAAGTTLAGFYTAKQELGQGWFKAPLLSLRSHFKPMLSFAFSTNLNSTIGLVARENESLWVSAFLGTEIAGYYALAEGIVANLKFPVLNLSSTTYPELSREIARKRWEEVKDILLRSSRLAAAYSVSLVALLALLGKWVMVLLYGDESLPAFPLVLVLAVGHAFENTFFWNRVALLALNHPIFPTMINLLGTFLKVGAIFMFVYQYGEATFAYVMSAYLILTVGVIAWRAVVDVRRRSAVAPAVEGASR